VQRAKSFEEIRDGLLDLYPDMDTSDLGAMMQQALTAAELSGRFEVSQGE
jgi:phage gp29-like protein